MAADLIGDASDAAAGARLEQYKLYVGSAESTTARRDSANAFFLSAHSLLLGVMAFVFDKANGLEHRKLLTVLGVVGLVFTWNWFARIESFRQLLSGKWRVVAEVEELLPLRVYSHEWRTLGRGWDPKTYQRVSRNEKIVVLLIGAVYATLIGSAYL